MVRQWPIFVILTFSVLGCQRPEPGGIIKGETLAPAEFKEAKTLVLAPHPDDEILMTAGVINSAVLNKENIFVAIVTNGDRKGKKYGLKRQMESVCALEKLGLKQNHIFFMGYGLHTMEPLFKSEDPNSLVSGPKGNTETYAEYGADGKDFHSFLTGKPASYTRANLRADMLALIDRLRPEKIYTTSLEDRHPDHSYTGHFLIQAISDLRQASPRFNPDVLFGVIHADPKDKSWPKRGFHPNEHASTPPWLSTSNLAGLRSESLSVPATMQDRDEFNNLKVNAIDCFVSQHGGDALGRRPSRDWMLGFVKLDELFWHADLKPRLVNPEVVTAPK